MFTISTITMIMTMIQWHKCHCQALQKASLKSLFCIFVLAGWQVSSTREEEVFEIRVDGKLVCTKKRGKPGVFLHMETFEQVRLKPLSFFVCLSYEKIELPPCCGRLPQ